MEIFDLIRKRRATRKYTNRPIGMRLLKKIVTSGIWGPSVLHKQPGKFVVVCKQSIIQKIADLMIKESDSRGFAVKAILLSSARTVKEAKALIFFYNNGAIVKLADRFETGYEKFAKMAEVAAIAAAIQNIILVSESFGIGTCWFDIPLLCEKKINELVGSRDELIAILTLGYPAVRGKRSRRNPYKETIKFIQ
jgi:nitroreductase